MPPCGPVAPNATIGESLTLAVQAHSDLFNKRDGARLLTAAWRERGREGGRRGERGEKGERGERERGV